MRQPHPNYDKTMKPENDSEQPKPAAEEESLVGVASTDLFAVFDDVRLGIEAIETERIKGMLWKAMLCLVCDKYAINAVEVLPQIREMLDAEKATIEAGSNGPNIQDAWNDFQKEVRDVFSR